MQILAALLGIAAAAVLGAFAFAWSGLGDIAASRGHWPFVERFLDFGMRHAVKGTRMALRCRSSTIRT